MLYIFYLILFLLVLEVYLRIANPMCKSNQRLDGKTAIVTGGTSGIGLEIAMELARRGARVIIACPFEKEGLQARKHIVNKTKNEEIVFKLLDLSSLQSVREFVSEITKSEEQLHILVNNAGIFVTENYITKDGMDLTMQTNYFGHFLLTLLLLPLLKKTGQTTEPSRIINVSSQAHFKGIINFEKMNNAKFWTFFQMYANSKLCVTLFTQELTKKLNKANVVVNNADPGYAATFIVKFNNIILKIVYYLLIKVLQFTSINAQRGAQTAIHLALDIDAGRVSGETFRNCKLSKAVTMTNEEHLMKRLWDESIKLVKLSFEEVKGLNLL